MEVARENIGAQRSLDSASAGSAGRSIFRTGMRHVRCSRNRPKAESHAVIRRRGLTPDRHRRLTPANTAELVESSPQYSLHVGSMSKADGGQSSALIYSPTDRLIHFA